jgi:DNA-binding beta-propeller fold protein YncE
VRKDIAAQIWDYGVGPTELSETIVEDPFEKLKQTRVADIVVGGIGQAAGQFQSPRAVAVGQKFDANGNFLLAWGSAGNLTQSTDAPGLFNEPWGIAVDSAGNVYVSDTWFHRVQKFNADGQFLTSWGVFGTDLNDLYAMWGPRGIAVDAQNRVYVADTGNKRVLIYDQDGNALGQVGGPGSLEGQFDEPVGVAVSGDGRIFVADTWNQRVEVFGPDYAYQSEWPIVGWYGQSLDNKPYLALDGGGRVYVSDPEGYRVLVYTETGEPLESWGDFGVEAHTFGLPAGLAVDAAAGTQDHAFCPASVGGWYWARSY